MTVSTKKKTKTAAAKTTAAKGAATKASRARTSKAARKAPPALSLEDATHDAQAFATSQPWAAALGDQEIIPSRFDAIEGARVALRLSNTAAPYMAQFELLERAKPGIVEALTRLPTLARAARYARNRRDESAAGEDEVKVPEDLVIEGSTLKDHMLGVLAYNLTDRKSHDLLAHIRRGKGRRDLANDLEALSLMYTEKANDLVVDTRKFDPADGVRAAAIANQIHGHLDEEKSHASQDWALKLNRVSTLLEQAYRRVRRTVRFLTDEDGGPDSIHAAIAQDTPRRRLSPDDEEIAPPTDGPTTSAPTTAASTTTTDEPAASDESTTTAKPTGTSKPK